MTDRGNRHDLGCPLRRWSAMGQEHCICSQNPHLTSRSKVSGSMLERTERLSGELKALAAFQEGKPHRQEEYLYLSQRLLSLHDGHLLDQAKEDWPEVYKDISDSTVVPLNPVPNIKLPHGVLPTERAGAAMRGVEELDAAHAHEGNAVISGMTILDDNEPATQAALLSAVHSITKNTDELWEYVKLSNERGKQITSKRDNDSDSIHQELTRQGLLQVAHGEDVSKLEAEIAEMTECQTGESKRITYAHEKIEAVERQVAARLQEIIQDAEKNEFDLKELMNLLRTELVQTALRAEAKANDSLNQMNQVRNVVGGDIEPRITNMEKVTGGDLEPRVHRLETSVDGDVEPRVATLERELAGLAGKVYGPK